MTHLDELRLMELGIESATQPNETESVHLRDCAACRGALESERALTGMLERLPQVEVPAGFVLHARARFAQARSARRRTLAWSLAAAALLGAMALASLVVGVGGELPRLVADTGWVVARLATLGRVAFVLLRTLPLLSTALIAAIGASVLIWVTLLTQLTHVRVPSR